MRLVFTIVSACLFVFFVSIADSQGGSNQPIILQYADSLVGTRGDNATIREFSGNVVLTQGNVTVKCDKAVQYLEANRAELSGNVHINQQELDLYTPFGIYNGRTQLATAFESVRIVDKKTKLKAEMGIYSTATQIADFEDNVKIEDDSVIIYSDKLIYHKLDRNSFAYGNVMIKGKYSNAFLFGDTVLHYPNERKTIISGSPKLFQIDTVKIDSISIAADSLNSLPDSTLHYKFDTLSVKSKLMKSITIRNTETDYFYFLDSVEIRREHLAARADTAIYNKKDGIIRLLGNPVVWYDSTQMHSDSIIIFIPEMKLSEIYAVGNSIVLSRDDTTNLSRINQIKGNKIVIKFENDSINAIFSFGDAKSLYFMSADSSGQGAQRSSSDSLTVLFRDGEVDEINWLGAVSGEFYPEHLIPEAKTFNLPGFIYSEFRPQKINFVIKRFD